MMTAAVDNYFRTHVVLSIEGVLASCHVKSVEQAVFFNNKGAILTAQKTYYIFPGVLEFIKLLFQTNNTRVSFVDTEIKESKSFVKQLVARAIGKKNYKKIKKEIGLYSRNEATKRFGHLENAIYIDDKIPQDTRQMKKVLHVPHTHALNFENLKQKKNTYSPSGYKPLHCFISDNERVSQYLVSTGAHIGILKTKKVFEIHFLNKDSNNYEIKSIPPKKHPLLIAELDKAYQKCTKQYMHVYRMENIEVTKLLLDLTLSFGGRTHKIQRAANRIYYATGLYFTALEQSKSAHLSVSEALFNLQFEKSGKSKCEILRKQDHLYHFGLEMLKTINPDLQLTTPQTYDFEITRLISDKERALLQKDIDHEKDCSIQ